LFSWLPDSEVEPQQARNISVVPKKIWGPEHMHLTSSRAALGGEPWIGQEQIHMRWFWSS
jgi:hypothetical protein